MNISDGLLSIAGHPIRKCKPWTRTIGCQSPRRETWQHQATRFADLRSMLRSKNIRGNDVFLVQSTCSPANDHLMELLIMTDACKGCRSVVAVIPTTVMPDRIEGRIKSAHHCRVVADLLIVVWAVYSPWNSMQVVELLWCAVDNLYSNSQLVACANYLSGV